MLTTVCFVKVITGKLEHDTVKIQDIKTFYIYIYYKYFYLYVLYVASTLEVQFKKSPIQFKVSLNRREESESKGRDKK